MKLNWAERWVVNNPLRVVEQRIELRKLSRMMPLKPGFTALEIGCGRGAGAGLILDIFQPSLLYATDLDVAMLKKAGKYISSDKMERIVLVAADGFRLPFRTGSLDAVFDFGVLHHIPDWRSALGEVARVLKMQGSFLFRRALSYSVSEFHHEAYPSASERGPFSEPGSQKLDWMLPDFLSTDMENGKVLASLVLPSKLRLEP